MPDLQVQTTHGMKNIPDNYIGKWIVLFSHPVVFTFVCTMEFVAFPKGNTELIGLSIDQMISQIKWIECINDNLKVEINFPIIPDDKKVAMQDKWPNNEIIGNKKIIPRPKSMALIEERNKEEGFGWWFKYKNLN